MSSQTDTSSRAIVSSTLWQMGSQITMAALSIVTIKLVTMGLSIELAGLYNSAYGFLQIFGILADFGLYAVAVREMSKSGNQEKTLGTLLTLRLIITSLSLGSALLCAWVIPAWQGTPLPLGITIAAFVPFFTLLAGMIRTVFQVHYKLQFVFIAEVGQRVLTLALTAGLIFWGARQSADPTVYLLFMAVGGVGAVLLFLVSLAYGNRFVRVRLRWDPKLVWSALKLAAPYGLAFLAMTLYRQIDVTLIALLRPDYPLQNAYYGFVQRIMDMAYLLPTFLLNSTLPVLSERFSKGEETRHLLGRTLTIVLLIGVTSLLFSVLWSRPLMELLTNAQYLSTPTRPGSDTALELLGISMFFNGLILFGFYTLLTRNEWKPLVITLLCGAAFSITLNLWLIPTHGFIGAAITSALTHTLLALALFPQALQRMPATFQWGTMLRLFLYAVVLTAFLVVTVPFLTNSYWTAGGLVVATGLVGGMAWKLGLLKTN